MNYLFKRFQTPLLVFLLLLSALSTFGQAVNSAIKDVVMPSPNAASLGKYGDIPVSYYSGVPSVGIPIHTVQQGSISLPISLSYHAGGVKVGEPASWVGLNWSLSAGGMISRTVQGKADERGNTGYLSIGDQMQVTQYIINQQSYQCTNGIKVGGVTYDGNAVNGGLSSGQFDGEPDIFSFSIGGYSGKFYIDAKNIAAGETKGKVVLVPKQDVLVEYDVLTNADGSVTGTEKCLYKFTLTTPNGVKYEFGDIGDGNPALEVTRPYNAIAERYVTGWYLKQITAPDGVNKINLTYTAESYRYAYRTSYGNNNVPNSANGKYAQNLVDLLDGYRLDNIFSSGGKTTSGAIIMGAETVSFIAGAERTDVQAVNSTTPKAKRLSAIQVFNDRFCKKFTLSQSYFQDTSPDNSGQDTDYRLKLDSIQEAKCTGDSAIAPHVFKYYGQAGNENYLPNRLSSATDHWGYYNGATTNPKTGINIPYTHLKYYDPVFERNYNVKEGISNRETDEESMKLGTIRQVQYPTGGTTTFEYEANAYFDNIGRPTLVPENTLSYYMPSGACNTNINPPQSIVTTITYPDNMFFKLTHRRATNYMGTCSQNNSVSLRLYNNLTNTQMCSTEIAPSSMVKPNTNGYIEYEFATLEGALTDIFPCLTAAGSYRIEVQGWNSAAEFVLQKEMMVDVNTSKKVGGLRIKKITSSDGISTANDVSKSYKYTEGDAV